MTMDYENVQNNIINQFPNAKFTIAIDYDKLDNVVSLQRTIYILDNRQCYCYNDDPFNTKVYKITTDKVITNRLILQELIKQGLTLDCNHFFIEDFHMLNSNTFEIMTGS